MERSHLWVTVICWIAVSSVLHVGRDDAHGQEVDGSAGRAYLPLAVGNRWEYRWLADGHWPQAGATIEVRDQVRIAVASAGSSTARGRDYYGVHFSEGTYLFPGGYCCGARVIYARQDEDGNVWAAATAGRDGEVESLGEEQPWWMRSTNRWRGRLRRTLPLVSYETLEIGPDGDVSEDLEITARARQMLPGFALGGPWHMAVILATENPVDLREVEAVCIAGLGPFLVTGPLSFEQPPGVPPGMLQLVRAMVDGTEYVLPRGTAIEATGWGQLRGRALGIQPIRKLGQSRLSESASSK